MKTKKVLENSLKNEEQKVHVYNCIGKMPFVLRRKQKMKKLKKKLKS